ncbi:cytochrome P450 [Daedaleopsis nitida]|nr:cytochrome P450 [Daedaleopsis nitida]
MDHSIQAAALAVLIGLVAVVGTVTKALPYLKHAFSSNLLAIPGPPCRDWLLGNHREIYASDRQVVCDEWIERYGRTIGIRGFLNIPRLYTTDTRALSHILMHPDEYQKPDETRYSLAQLMGHGPALLDTQHRKQRKFLNPGFSLGQIRRMTSVFLKKSSELREIWDSEVTSTGDQVARINVLKHLSQMAFDVVGLACFGHDFQCLSPDDGPDALGRMFEDVFDVPGELPILMIVKYFLPFLSFIPDARTRRIRRTGEILQHIAYQIVERRKSDIKTENDSAPDCEHDSLLFLLLNAKIGEGTSESQGMSDEEIIERAFMFLITGHETTSSTLAWCLFELAQLPAIQAALRRELLAVGTDTPTMDQLMVLPYLDMVLRETLRLYPSVPSTNRVATVDDIIPLGIPISDRDGRATAHINIKRGELIVIPVATINRLKELWGDDALEFKPERWKNPPVAVSAIPGVWGNLLTFLGGPRACIGYRFALVEMKATLFTLLRAFEFELAVPAAHVHSKTVIVQRPLLRGVAGEIERCAMPLLVRRVRAHEDE